MQSTTSVDDSVFFSSVGYVLIPRASPGYRLIRNQ